MTDRLFSLRKKRSTDKKRYYNQIRYPEIPLSMDDVYIITKTGDRTDLMASNYYGNSDLWWVLVKANPNKLNVPLLGTAIAFAFFKFINFSF